MNEIITNSPARLSDEEVVSLITDLGFDFSLFGKLCTKCKKFYTYKDGFYRHKCNLDGRGANCKSCIKKYNQECGYKLVSKNYYKNVEENRRKNRKKMREYREKFLELYGNKCECCGEDTEIFLSLDHINGQRGRKRENPYTAYLRAIKDYPSKEFRILCHNCNQATKYGRICPHQLEKQNG